MTVRNMTSVNGNSVPNQFIITSCGGDAVTFQSYDSVIATIRFDTGYVFIGKDWDFSRTTAKYRNIFFKHYLYQLSDKKAIEEALESGRCGAWIVKPLF